MTNIKNILDYMLGKTSAEFMSHPNGTKIIMPTEEILKHSTEAQAQLQKAFEEGYEKIIGEEPREDVVDDNGIGYSPERFALLTNYKNQRTKAKQVIKEMF
jgi:hypothetical protein